MIKSLQYANTNNLYHTTFISPGQTVTISNNTAGSKAGQANVGVGFRFALGESGRTALRLDFEDYLYNGDFGGGDEFQNDLVGSLGLSIALGGRADPNEP